MLRLSHNLMHDFGRHGPAFDAEAEIFSMFLAGY
jgi:hypothetical protein